VLTFDGLVDLVPQLIEPAPLGFPLWDHVLHKKRFNYQVSTSSMFAAVSSPDQVRDGNFVICACKNNIEK
jgi:hypothetical protein